MSNKHTWTAVLATVAAVCLPLSSLGQLDGMTLDQSNDNFGYYFYDASSIWQSFTAGMDGHLRAIQAHIYATNDAPWTATFEIREGQGTAGTLLASQTIAGDGVKQQRTFVLENPVRQVSGATYSFVVRNASTGLTVRASADLYAGGRSHHANYDYNFMTWVLASNWSDPAWRDTTFTSGSTVITTPEQLAQFAWLVNDGTSFTGQRIVLAADIDLGAHYWTPAGTDAARFDGTFDGAGHTISGLLIEHPGVDCQGLFGVTGSNSSIEDVALLDADVRGGTYTGGIVGRSYGEVRRCRAAGTVAGGSMVGGVAGRAESTLQGCVNAASVSGFNGVGGVAGVASGVTEECANSGSIDGANDVGGVAGTANSELRRCTNSGTVTAQMGESTGGVAGSCVNASILACSNSGDVDGPASVGGIVGNAANGVIDRCANTGRVGGGWAGGIAGGLSRGTIRNCVNRGAVDLLPNGVGGGIVSDNSNGTVMNCANEGAVTGAGEYGVAGGIVGWNWGGQNRNCANSGAVTGEGALGGLAGGNDDGGVVAGCFWKRTGTAPFSLDAIGMDGLGDVEGCRFFGAAPGTLDAPVTVGGHVTDSLADALNAWMAMARDDEGLPLRRWTPGSACAYPAVVVSRWSDEGNFTTDWYDAEGAEFVIRTPAELAGLAVLVNAGTTFADQWITLAADLAMADHEWTPIGAVDAEGEIVSAFAGFFNGNGKTVSGIYVDRHSAFVSAGLFGAAQSAFIANLAVAGADISAAGGAGALCGSQEGAWIFNCASGGRISGGETAGGISGRLDGDMGLVMNSWSDARVDGPTAGGVVGSAPEDPNVGYCFWKQTGASPYDLPAVGDGGIDNCYAFAGPPGVLAGPPEELPPTLAGALNSTVYMMGSFFGIDFYGWTPGTASRYPVMAPLIRVDGEPVEATFSDGFCAGLTYPEVDAAVAAYRDAHPETTAETFGALLCQADAMGFTFGELAADDAIFAFDPSLAITAFDPAAGRLTFRVANGIDTTPQAAMNRLAASAACAITVQQMGHPGGTAVALCPAVEFHSDGTACAPITPTATDRAFFKIRLDHSLPSMAAGN